MRYFLISVLALLLVLGCSSSPQSEPAAHQLVLPELTSAPVDALAVEPSPEVVVEEPVAEVTSEPSPSSDDSSALVEGPPAPVMVSTPPLAFTPAPEPRRAPASVPSQGGVLLGSGLPSPDEVLSAMEEVMAGVGSWEMELEVMSSVSGSQGAVGFTLSLSGERESTMRERFDMEMILLGVPFIQVEVLTYDGIRYVRDSGFGVWHVDSGSLPIGGDLAGLDGDGFQVEGVLGMKVLGETDLDGVRVYRLSGVLSEDSVLELAGDASDVFSEGTVYYWIGVEDSYLYRSSFALKGDGEGFLPDSALVTMTMEYNLRGHGTDIVVLFPEDVSDEPYSGPLWDSSTSPSS